MQMCPYCDRIYDESEYSHCPYCSGLFQKIKVEEPYKNCPNCGGTMFLRDGVWFCENCGREIDGSESEDGTISHEVWDDDLWDDD